MKNRNGFLYFQKQWKLVLPSTFNTEVQKLLEIAIAQVYMATDHGGIRKTMKVLTYKFECQSFSSLVREYVGSYDICQRTK